eukprot:g2475.t1
MILLPAAIWLLASVDAIHPKSDDRIWGVHPPCFNGTTELPEYAFKNCRKIHMTTRDTDKSVHNTLGEDEWHHYHFVIDDFNPVNRRFGSKVHFQLEPCKGSIYLYVKPAMLLEGMPMMQMFETDPFKYPPGQRSKFWPFPDENTATEPQGPDNYLLDPGQEYPGPLFKVYPWGFKSENDGVMNGVGTKLVHGAYFISIHAQVDTDYRLSVYTTDNKEDPDPNLTPAEIKAIEDAEKKVLEDRRKSTKQDPVIESYGRYSELSWLQPNISLAYAGNDLSRMWDLSQFDEYQVWYAMDSRTHFERIAPLQVTPPPPLPAPIENPEVDAVQGYCSFNNTENSTSYHCIMETECGIRLNGLPYTEKLNKNWDEKDYVLKKEVCKATEAGPSCKPSETHKEYIGRMDWVRYEIRRNKYSVGGNIGDPCGFPYYSEDGYEHPNSNYGPVEKYKCKQGLKCDADQKTGQFVCQKDYLEFKTMTDDEIAKLQMYIVTMVPHHCWETGEQFCMKGSKRFDAPTINIRRKLTVAKRDLKKGEILFKIEGVDKLQKTLEEALIAVWTLDGIQGKKIPEVADSDVPKMRKRTDIHIVTRISGFKGNSTGKAHLEMPCAQPWPCSMFTWRSRTLALNVERHKCLEVEVNNGIPKCTSFHIIPEVYVAAMGNTTFDKETEPEGTDETIMWIAIGIASFFGVLIAIICFMRVKTSLRLYLAYKHTSENLDGMPDGINPEKEKIKAKKEKEEQKLKKEKEKMWEKQSKDRAKERARKAKDMEKRMKAINKDQQKKLKKEAKERKKKLKDEEKALKLKMKEDKKQLKADKAKLAKETKGESKAGNDHESKEEKHKHKKHHHHHHHKKGGHHKDHSKKSEAEKAIPEVEKEDATSKAQATK